MASVFDPLRDLTKGALSKEDFSWIVETLHTGQHDATVAIVGGAFAESALRDAVLSRIRESKSGNAEMFRRNGPLSSFDSLILMGFSLSIFGKKYRHDLDAIRHIRNAFAHAPRAINFGMKEVGNVCNTFHALEVADQFKEEPKTAREKFSFTVRTVSMFLILESEAPNRPTPTPLP